MISELQKIKSALLNHNKKFKVFSIANSESEITCKISEYTFLSIKIPDQNNIEIQEKRSLEGSVLCRVLYKNKIDPNQDYKQLFSHIIPWYRGM